MKISEPNSLHHQPLPYVPKNSRKAVVEFPKRFLNQWDLWKNNAPKSPRGTFLFDNLLSTPF